MWRIIIFVFTSETPPSFNLERPSAPVSLAARWRQCAAVADQEGVVKENIEGFSWMLFSLVIRHSAAEEEEEK
jgi:hypothetical protein